MNEPIGASEDISPVERYQLFRNRIEHEDNLVMQRLSWLMASQSFLFSAYAIVTNGLSSPRTGGTNAFVNLLHILEKIVPIVALLNSLMIFVSILAALRAIKELRRQYQQNQEVLKTLPLQASSTTRVASLSAPVLLPLLFMAVWLFLVIKEER